MPIMPSNPTQIVELAACFGCLWMVVMLIVMVMAGSVSETSQVCTKDGVAVPGFVIAGAQRAYTTDLWERLQRHPDLQPRGGAYTFPEDARTHHWRRKESNFLTMCDVHKRLGKPTEWCSADNYKAAFYNNRYYTISKELYAFQPDDKKHKGCVQSYEATPEYLLFPSVPGALYQIEPKVKVVVLLKDPVERAVAHYTMVIAKTRDAPPSLTFDDFVQTEAQCAKKVLAGFQWSPSNKAAQAVDRARVAKTYSQLFDECTWPQLNMSRVNKPHGLTLMGPVVRGLYFFQLMNWRQWFDSKQIIVVQEKWYAKNSVTAINEILSVLRLDAFKVPAPGTPPPPLVRFVEQASRQSLADFYKPYNSLLESFLSEESAKGMRVFGGRKFGSNFSR